MSTKKRSLLLKIKDAVIESVVDFWLRFRIQLIQSSVKISYYDCFYMGVLPKRFEFQLSWPNVYINVTRSKHKSNRNEPTVSVSFNMYTGVTIYKDVDGWLCSVHVLGFGLGISKSEGF